MSLNFILTLSFVLCFSFFAKLWGKAEGKTVGKTVGKTMGILGKVQKKKEEKRTYRACALQAKNRENDISFSMTCFFINFITFISFSFR